MACDSVSEEGEEVYDHVEYSWACSVCDAPISEGDPACDACGEPIDWDQPAVD